MPSSLPAATNCYNWKLECPCKSIDGTATTIAESELFELVDEIANKRTLKVETPASSAAIVVLRAKREQQNGWDWDWDERKESCLASSRRRSN